jgi:hypothetical protein
MKDKNIYPRSATKKRRWFLEIESRKRQAYAPGKFDLADIVLRNLDVSGQYYTAVMTSMDDDAAQISAARRLSSQEASRLDRLESTPDDLLDIARTPKYKPGDRSTHFDNPDQIISWLDTQIMCDNLPIDEVYHCTENDTKLVWSRKP